MNVKTVYISIIILIIFSISFGIFILYNFYSNEPEINLDFFREMAENKTSCSDIRNDLYLIDENIVFWIVEGSCSDASYSYTLFGENPQKILCKAFDSIAGPQETCNDEEYREIFNVLTNNVDVYNFGLNNTHKVRKFF